MTTIRHHLTENILMGYATGSLPEAFNLVVATHVSLCDDCRVTLAGYEALGGAVLEDMAAGTEASLAATLTRIAAAPAEVPVPARTRGIFPAPLQDYVGGDLAAVKWKGLGGGVAQAILPTARDASVRLLRIPGGAVMPDHGHRGMEMTLVLQGAFRDTTDWFGVGDVEVADAALTHQPVAEAGPDCICLAATDAPLRFRAFIPRMVQGFLRI